MRVVEKNRDLRLKALLLILLKALTYYRNTMPLERRNSAKRVDTLPLNIHSFETFQST